jgi:hypothetical protein
LELDLFELKSLSVKEYCEMSKKKVFITIDDGPSDYTIHFADELEKF